MMSSFKESLKRVFLLSTVLALMLCSFAISPVSAAEQNYNNYTEIYKEVATNFLKNQYEQRGIDYNSFSIILESDMYSNDEKVVAKVLVALRDEEYDYVVLNLITYEIDEYAFNDEKALEKYSQKVYYTGLLNYYVKENDTFVHFDKTELTESEFSKQSEEVNELYSAENSGRDNNPVPSSKDGYNGFYSWSEVDSLNTAYNNSEWKYISGISWDSISGTSLSFFSQNYFNSHFSTNNACGPTALTNMFVWFEYRNIKNRGNTVNALLNGNAYDTFARFRELTNHSNTSGTSTSTYTNALTTYANEQNYNSEIYTNLNTFDKIKTNIDNNRPIMTSIQLSGWGGHAVLTVGYETFVQSYEVQHSFLWIKWTTTEYRYTKYLRVIDGWSTANSSRFIDATDYWDSITGWGFNITN